MKIIDLGITAISVIKSPEKRETIKIAKQLTGKRGIEIGGPSNFFKHRSFFPVYLYADTVDGVNFSSSTTWEGQIKDGQTYKYLKNRKPGFQYITEAAELNNIPNNKYDFLLSCHSLEHMANPIKALKRWHQVLKEKGLLILSLPNKEVTFDSNRPYTTFTHLLDDFNTQKDEHDETHFEEIITLHKKENDPNFTTVEELKNRTLANFANRCAHHHVFSFNLITEMLNYTGFEVLIQKEVHGIHLFTIARKIN